MFARLAGYEATTANGLDGRYASGYTHPANDRAVAPGHIAAPADVLEDRRGAPRYALHSSVRAKARTGEEWHAGQTVDASMTGLCLEMAVAPEDGYLDVELDSGETIGAWARVVSCTVAGEGRYLWRLRLVSYDVGYPALLSGLDPIETGFASPPVEAASDADQAIVPPAGRWLQLLDRATA